MTTTTKSALAAAILMTCFAAAFAETGRPVDYVPAVHPDVTDRQADDALARYEMVLDGGASRSAVAYHAQAVHTDDVDSYAKYLMVIDGMSRESAMERSRARQQSIASAGQSRLARASRSSQAEAHALP